MKLIFATLIRWRKDGPEIAISDLERDQLQLLRQELEIDPPSTRKENTTTENAIAA